MQIGDSFGQKTKKKKRRCYGMRKKSDQSRNEKGNANVQIRPSNDQKMKEKKRQEKEALPQRQNHQVL